MATSVHALMGSESKVRHGSQAQAGLLQIVATDDPAVADASFDSHFREYPSSEFPTSFVPKRPTTRSGRAAQVLRVVPGRPQSRTRTIAPSTRIMTTHMSSLISLMIRCRGVNLQHIGVAFRSVRPSGHQELSSSGRRRDQKSFSR
jgi:hypothetical protein